MAEIAKMLCFRSRICCIDNGTISVLTISGAATRRALTRHVMYLIERREEYNNFAVVVIDTVWRDYSRRRVDEFGTK